MPEPNKVEGEMCPFCHHKTLTLMEELIEIPYFGNTFVFSMRCSSCKYSKADLEAEENKPPAKYTLDITDSEDMSIRVIKSSQATVKVPRIASIEPGQAADGYVTNVEGIFQRIKDQLESIKNNDDDEDAKNKARKMIKKINRIIIGQDSAKLIIEDPSGNSAIISDKAVKGKI